MKLQLSVITMVLLCVILTVSSKIKEHVVKNENTESSVTAILGSNPDQSQNEEDFRNQQDEFKNVKKQVSKYTGVTWDKNRKKWKAGLKQNKKQHHIGYFENEEHAAMNVNSLCDRLGIEHKNPTIDIEVDKIYQVQDPTSKYNGVSWNTRDKKWLTQVMHNGKKYSPGKFDNEKHAAMQVNLLCDKFGIKRKNPMIDSEPDAIQQEFKSKTSIYIGVSWNNNAKKWKAEFYHKSKKCYAGLFDKEEDAAMSINLLCDKYELARKNPTIDVKLFEAYQAQELSSQYIGVSWHKDRNTWQAQLMHKGKNYCAGSFGTEKHAAMKLNLLCDKFGIKRKNPMLDIEFDAMQQSVKHPTSKYIGVCWNKSSKCWVAQLVHNKKQYYGGYFDNEEHAAMKVNLLCDEYETERKNPTIEINPDVMKQKTKSSKMHEFKAENIVNEKVVKVEEENILYGLKDQCENNFMKKSCQSQKRKRKEDSILKVNTTPNYDGNEVFEELQKDYIKILD